MEERSGSHRTHGPTRKRAAPNDDAPVPARKRAAPAHVKPLSGARHPAGIRTELEQLARSSSSQALEVAAPCLFHPSPAIRCACCATVTALLRQAAGRGEELGKLGKDVLRNVLAQLASLSVEVRLAALETLQHFPRWDVEVLNRAVRIPLFQKIVDEEDTTAAGAKKAKAEPPEIWHGALFFALDDEEPMVRARAFRVILLEMCHRRASEEVPEIFRGIFQRLASVAALALQDASDLVRREAAAMLVEIMSTRAVGLCQKAEKAGGPVLASVLQAFWRDPAAVLQVLEKSRFTDLPTLQDALLWILSVELPQDSKLCLDPVALRLAEELQRLEATPEVYKKAKKVLMMDSAARPGTRLLTAALLHGTEPLAPAGLAVALAQGRGSAQMDRLRSLVDSVAQRIPGAADHLRGEALPPARSGEDSPAEPTLTYWLQSLEWHWDVVRCGLAQASRASKTDPLSPLSKASADLRKLGRALTSAASDASDAADHGPLFSRLAAAAAWAEALRYTAEAGLRSREVSGTARLASALKLHQATSRLMHCFVWPIKPFPRILLGLRLLSFRLLADAEPEAVEDLEIALQTLQPEAPTARLLQRPLEDFMPTVSKSYFQTLLTSPAIETRAASLRWTEAGRPRLTSQLPAQVLVDIVTGYSCGLVLVIEGNEALSQKVPLSRNTGLRTQRMECAAPAGSAGLSLRLRLDVDGASEGGIVQGSTGVSPQRHFYRLVNHISLGDPLEVGPRMT